MKLVEKLNNLLNEGLTDDQKFRIRNKENRIKTIQKRLKSGGDHNGKDSDSDRDSFRKMIPELKKEIATIKKEK